VAKEDNDCVAEEMKDSYFFYEGQLLKNILENEFD
jgi:hypothetical protein